MCQILYFCPRERKLLGQQICSPAARSNRSRKLEQFRFLEIASERAEARLVKASNCFSVSRSVFLAKSSVAVVVVSFNWGHQTEGEEEKMAPFDRSPFIFRSNWIVQPRESERKTITSRGKRRDGYFYAEDHQSIRKHPLRQAGRPHTHTCEPVVWYF